MRNRLTSLALALAAVLILAPAAGATTFTVDNTGSSADANLNDGICATGTGACSLRAAIEQSNFSSAGAPHTIDLSFVTEISVPAELPPITRNGTFVDGCGVGRDELPPPATEPGAPKPPATDPCVGLKRTDVNPISGLIVRGADDVVIQGLAMTNFGRAVRLWGSDRAEVRGNWFGQRIDGTTQEGNDVAVAVTDRTQDGQVVDAATANIIGGASDADDSGSPTCTASLCNLILNSKVTGVDLTGTAAAIGPGDAPSAATGVDEGTQIRGNWIGVRTAAGQPAANATAISIGDSRNAVIGGDPVGHGNVIAGNDHGVDQGSGTKVVWLLGGVYGMSPDREHTVANGFWNARLRGGPTQADGVVVDHAVFGPADIGLDLEGPMAQVTGSAFYSPDDARFQTAGIRAAPGADRVFIGSAAGAAPGCAPLADGCNSIAYTADGTPGIWIDGADDARIQRNAVGGTLFTPPLAGPPIRIDGGAAGATVGDVNDNVDERNVLTRASGIPAIEVGEGATGVVIGDNEGIAIGGSGLFTDLLPGPGFGNSGPVNGGIQPPLITLATVQGVGGTATPGATVRVLQLQRVPPQGDPNPVPYPPGYTFPTTPSVTTADANGIWGIAFPADLKVGQKLLAAQTTAAGSSEYASPETAAASNPSPLVTFTSGPPTVVQSNVRSATFTFTSNKAGSSFQCSLDAGSFVACTSPYAVNGLDTGGHQLQVKATDPIGKQGPPASRNWSILFADPVPAPAPRPAASSAKAVRFSSVVSLPSARKCVSRRSLKITVRTPKGSKVKSIVVRIGKRRVATIKNTKKRIPSKKGIPISLRGLRSGKFVVKVEVTLTDKAMIKGSRTYRTCVKKKAAKRR